MPLRASARPSGETSTTSNAALANSPSDAPANSGFTPIISASGVTGSVSLRSMARPPGSAMCSVSCASSGRVVSGILAMVTSNFALPAASVLGRSSSGCSIAAFSSSLSALPKV